MNSNLCYAYRVVLGLIVIIYQQTLALCLSTSITYGLRFSSSGCIVLSVEFATKGRFVVCRPFQILLLGACSWKLNFVCFDVGYVSFKTRDLEFGDRDLAN
jgi:hypothetical protein